MKGFQLTISTILILVVLLITTVIVLFFFTNTFGSSGVNIANIAGSLNKPTKDITEGQEKIGGMSDWANPFSGENGAGED